jgi:hypothetical protein
MSKIHDRYSSAVHSGNLRSKPDTEMSDSDMLGAAGLAAKRVPLAIGLARLFAGDDREGAQLVQILSSMAWGKAKAEGIKLKRVQADDMARAVLAWHRSGTCKVCGGHGYKLAGGILGEGRAVISDAPCDECKGSRKVNFDRLFAFERLLLARWLREAIEAEQGVAGAEIMKALAPRMDL